MRGNTRANPSAPSSSISMAQRPPSGSKSWTASQCLCRPCELEVESDCGRTSKAEGHRATYATHFAPCDSHLLKANRGYKCIGPRPWENGVVVERYVTLISVHTVILARVFAHSVPSTIRKTVYCDFSASEHILYTQRLCELLAENTQMPGEGEEPDQHSIHLDFRTLRKAHLLSCWLGAYELQGWITAGNSQYATFINSKGQLGRAFISAYCQTARKEYKTMFEQATPRSPERKHALTMLELFPKAAAHSIAGVSHENTLMMLLNGATQSNSYRPLPTIAEDLSESAEPGSNSGGKAVDDPVNTAVMADPDTGMDGGGGTTRGLSTEGHTEIEPPANTKATADPGTEMQTDSGSTGNTPAEDNAEVDHPVESLASKDHDTAMVIDGGTAGGPSTEEDTEIHLPASPAIPANSDTDMTIDSGATSGASTSPAADEPIAQDENEDENIDEDSDTILNLVGISVGVFHTDMAIADLHDMIKAFEGTNMEHDCRNIHLFNYPPAQATIHQAIGRVRGFGQQNECTSNSPLPQWHQLRRSPRQR
ncbi:hypothetical protein ZTR_04268 [Talaromyces verruculosus]|nr:hypothetical protein ZTR_04268 [Talaromyces verruculosus]